MPVGKNISKETRQKIWSFYNLGKTSEECHSCLFFGSDKLCTLRHIKYLFRMFANPDRNEEVIKYLANTSSRGNQRLGNSSRWYDELVNDISIKHPTIKLFDLRLRLQELLGGGQFKLPSISSVGRSLQRCKLKRKRCTFLSYAQDPVEVFDHMDRMKCINVDYIVNWDETSANSEKFRPKYGRGEGEVVVNEWRIGGKTYSAIAALTTLGFLPCTKIFDVACDSSTINQFLIGMEPFLLPTSMGLSITLLLIPVKSHCKL